MSAGGAGFLFGCCGRGDGRGSDCESDRGRDCECARECGSVRGCVNGCGDVRDRADVRECGTVRDRSNARESESASTRDAHLKNQRAGACGAVFFCSCSAQEKGAGLVRERLDIEVRPSIAQTMAICSLPTSSQNLQAGKALIRRARHPQRLRRG